MGRRPWTSRLTVEGCSLTLSVVDLRRTGVFASRVGSQWVLKSDKASVGYTVVEVPGRALGLRMNHLVTDHTSNARMRTEYVIEVTTTRPHFGGRHYWFRCPLVRDGFRCGRRVGRLYLLPGQQYFGCRHCWNLTYRSCQRHNKRLDPLMRDPTALTLALTSNNLEEALLGVRAYTRLCERLQKLRR
jgi:hypothetical protein